MECDEPNFVRNEETQPIQWTEQGTGALVATGSLWPLVSELEPNGKVSSVHPWSICHGALVTVSLLPRLFQFPLS